MNSVENLKSTQRRKLFKIFKSSRMQSLNIFGAREGFTFEFTSLSGVWKFENHLTGRARMSVAHFRLTTRDGRPVPHAAPIPGGRAQRAESAWRRWPPVVAAPRGLAPLTTAPDATEEVVAHSIFSPSPVQRHPSPPLCSAPAAASPSLPVADEPN
jgi:hypothetical protein